jgi:hypothetical protein
MQYSAALNNIVSATATVTNSQDQYNGHGGWIVYARYWFQYGGKNYTGNDYKGFGASWSAAKEFGNEPTVQIYFSMDDPSDNSFTQAVYTGGWITGIVIFTLLSACSVPAFVWMLHNITCALRKDIDRCCDTCCDACCRATEKPIPPKAIDVPIARIDIPPGLVKIDEHGRMTLASPTEESTTLRDYDENSFSSVDGTSSLEEQLRKRNESQ